ncbi:MAG: HipA domain-containing protein [Bacilli bacterium]|nr:HipA domain-containing protein [Bacilli bacterium]
MKILDLSNCPYSERNGFYGGAAGDKDGIIIDGEPWICKYPKPTIGMRKESGLSPLALTPLSEYLGSNIYRILGFPVHETRLGIRDGFLVVACKDFCSTSDRLFEIRTIKNIHIAEMRHDLNIDLHETGDEHLVYLNELFVHFNKNPELKNVPGLSQRFWDQVIVDGLLGNNDRNNGNWGIISIDGERRLAPIFDNGASFYPKRSDSSLEKGLSASLEEREANSQNIITPFTLDGVHHLNFKSILKLDENSIPEEEAELLKESMKRVAKLVHEHMDEIEELFSSLPSVSMGISVISDARREFYLSSFKFRFDLLKSSL